MTEISSDRQKLKDYVLAEFRTAIQCHQLCINDLTAIGLALKGDLITPYQAISNIRDTDAFRFVGKLPGENWGPEWAESARKYALDRQQSAPKQRMRA